MRISSAGHPSPDQLLAAAEGSLEQASHIESCSSCRSEVQELRRALARISQVPVPEPSPLFWDHLSSRIREAITVEPAPIPSRRPFMLATLGALAGAIAIITIGVAVTMRTAQPVHPMVAASHEAVSQDTTELAEVGDDSTWVVLGDIASQLDWEQASEAGLLALPGSADRALSEMSEEEQQQVVKVLESELQKAKQL
jgi:hypothetical protein